MSSLKVECRGAWQRALAFELVRWVRSDGAPLTAGNKKSATLCYVCHNGDGVEEGSLLLLTGGCVVVWPGVSTRFSCSHPRDTTILYVLVVTCSIARSGAQTVMQVCGDSMPVLASCCSPCRAALHIIDGMALHIFHISTTTDHQHVDPVQGKAACVPQIHE